MKKRIMMVLMVLLVLALALPVFAGGKKEAAPVTGESAAPKQVKIAYVCKMLTHPWFQEEEKGAKAKAAELGVQYFGIDANLDDEAFMQGVENAIAQGVNGLMVCITDAEMGPAVAQMTTDAKIPLIAINDPFNDQNGNPVPHVGVDTFKTCKIGGVAMAKLATEKGFFKAGNVVKVMSVDVSFKSFLHERTQGYQEGIMENSPLKAADMITQDNETGMFEQVLPVAQAIINSHPEATHWLVTGLNDDSAVAPLRALEEAGFNMNNVIACGMGGYSLSGDEFKKGNANYLAIKLDPQSHGSEGVRVLYENIVNKKPIERFTTTSGFVVGIADWQKYTWE